MSERFSLFGFILLYPEIIHARSVPRGPDESKPLSRSLIAMDDKKFPREKTRFFGPNHALCECFNPKYIILRWFNCIIASVNLEFCSG